MIVQYRYTYVKAS